MVKVYLPSLAICTFSLTVNLLVLGTYSSNAIAQESVPQTSNKQAANVEPKNVEPEILAEINRVRTNPQGYARWLEEQKQYYDNIWLKLPGEEPVRAHRLGNAIDEAIAILKEQQPLPPLDISEQTSAIATQKLEDFGTTNNNIQNISYGRKTAKGIVMSLVVDELFRDRRRRKSLLSPEANDTGIICQSDPRYAKVCAIAYSNSTVDNAVEKQPEATPSAETEIAKQPSPPPESPSPETRTAVVEPESSANNEPTSEPEATIEDTNTEDTETVAQQLPQPPKPQAPPAPINEPASEIEDVEEAEVEEAEVEEAEVEEKETEIARVEAEADAPENNEEDEQLEEVEQEIEEVEEKLEEVEQEIEEKEEIFEAEPEELEEEVATNSDSSRLLENVERGALEEGDRIIEEDGSFYDSYPLEAKSGESFTIALESSEFDAFVALIDSEGNIVEQNDDISEEDSNSRIRVTIPENGVYNVIVNAYDEGGTGQYVLTVTR